MCNSFWKQLLIFFPIGHESLQFYAATTVEASQHNMASQKLRLSQNESQRSLIGPNLPLTYMCIKKCHCDTKLRYIDLFPIILDLNMSNLDRK